MEREVAFDDLVNSCVIKDSLFDYIYGTAETNKYSFDDEFEFTTEHQEDWVSKYNQHANRGAFRKHHATVIEPGCAYRIHVDWRQFKPYFTEGKLSRDTINRECRQMAYQCEAQVRDAMTYGYVDVILKLPELDITESITVIAIDNYPEDTKKEVAYDVACILARMGFVITGDWKAPVKVTDEATRRQYALDSLKKKFMHNMGFTDMEVYNRWMKTKIPI